MVPRKSKAKKRQEDIERVAGELRQNRLLLGKSGDKHQDLEKAEKIVRSPFRTTLFASNRPLIRLEKNLIEPISQHLQDSATFDIIDRISPALEAIGILLIPLVLYWATQSYEQQRAAQEIERLQQETVQNYIGQLSEIFLNVDADLRDEKNQRIRTIATAATITLFRDPNLDSVRKGQIIEFLGQMELIQELESTKDGAKDTTAIISLSGADLSGADLSNTSLSRADLSNANLSNANLEGAYLNGADLSNANLEGAYLVEAKLGRAYLLKADLSNANLEGAYLSEADLSSTNLNKTNLFRANLFRVDLFGANLEGVDLSGANLQGVDLSEAKFCRTTLPDGITLDPNRDCEELSTDPKTEEWPLP